MYVRLHNKTARPVSIALNSRTMLHIPPRAVSGKIMRAEVNGNSKVTKLEKASVIEKEELGNDEKKRKRSGNGFGTNRPKTRSRNRK